MLTVIRYRAMATNPKMPPTSPPVSDGESVLPYRGDADGVTDITTVVTGMVESKLTDDSIADGDA
jgi:hypothetical protein